MKTFSGQLNAVNTGIHKCVNFRVKISHRYRKKTAKKCTGLLFDAVPYGTNGTENKK